MSQFTRVKHSKMLSRVQAAGLEGDEIGLYMIAFFLMCERDGPINDDMAWLGRKAGISTRRANVIKSKLLDCGLWHQRGGQIGDKLALEEVEYRAHRTEVATTNAMSRWQKDGQPQLDLGNGTSEQQERQISADPGHATASPGDNSGSGDANGGVVPEKDAINGGKTEDKPGDKPVVNSEESAENGQSEPLLACSDSHARATSKNLERRTLPVDSAPDSPAGSLDRSGEPKLDDADPQTLFQAVCTAAAFNPTDPVLIKRGKAQVERWRADGISFDRIVLPAVRAVMADTTDPTSSLYRFDRQIRHEHARVAAQPPPKAKGAPQPTVIATFEFSGEDPRFVEFRRDLCDAIGAATYVRLAHGVRFEQIDDKAIVRVNAAPGSYGSADHRLRDACLTPLRHVASRHGFNQVW